MHRSFRSQRGSVLLVALIFAGVVAIALTSYLRMTTLAMEVSQRSFLANDAMNVTEAGFERALWAFNQANANNANAWADWSDGLTASDKRRSFTFDNSTFSQNATGTVR